MTPNPEGDLSSLTYASAGVSVKDQNKVNAEVARRLREKGMKAEGLFGGAIDISFCKSLPSTVISVSAQSHAPSIHDFHTAGYMVTSIALQNARHPLLGVLDYVASANMDTSVADVVEGVADAALEHGTIVLGGESAQMRDTYVEGKYDVFSHVIHLSDKGCDITDLIKKMDAPTLVASTDGTGTKTKIIRNPEDIIAHGSNDISTSGARPLAFSLYIAGNVSKEYLLSLDKQAEEVAARLGLTKLESLVEVKPHTYLPGEVDIAGTVIGIVEKKQIITGTSMQQGDTIVGIFVDGLQTNGYSLARKVAETLTGSNDPQQWHQPRADLGGSSLYQELSKPHVAMNEILFGNGEVQGVLEKYGRYIRGMAHITGGGLPDNLPRMIPDHLKAIVLKENIPTPPFMQLCRDRGIAEEVLFSTFNMGVGYALLVSHNHDSEIAHYINKNFSNPPQKKAGFIGFIAPRAGDEPQYNQV